MTRLFQVLRGFDFKDILLLLSAGAVIAGLYLLFPPLAFIIPGAAVLVLGYRRRWF